MTDQNPSPADFANQAMADVITSAYSEERLTQKQLAARTGITGVTLQRILAGKRDIDWTQIYLLADAVGIELTELVERAERRAAKLADEAVARQMSDGGGTVTPIRKRVEDMSVEELEKLPHAATRDPEMDTDEHFD